jgi:hypothetical protein
VYFCYVFNILLSRWQSLLSPQSAAFAICAVVGGCLFVRWWRLDSQHRLRIWKLYGWFTGFVCVGSCTGAVSYAAWAQWLYNYYLSQRPTPFTNSTLENGPEDIESAVFYGKVSPFSDRCRRRLACALRVAQLPIIYPFAVFPMADCCSHHIPGSI